MPLTPQSRDALTARLNLVLAEASALAEQRDAREAEARRIILRLARMPEIETLPPQPRVPS